MIARVLSMQRMQQREERFFIDNLNGARQIFVSLFQPISRFPLRSEKIDKIFSIKLPYFWCAIFPAVRNVVGVMPEKFQVQSKGSVTLHTNKFAQFFDERRLAVWR